MLSRLYRQQRDGYPLYRRRDNTTEQHVIRNQAVHNGWIVPYNVFLSKTFEAHINVEMCHTVSAVKYLCKYFTIELGLASLGMQITPRYL